MHAMIQTPAGQLVDALVEQVAYLNTDNDQITDLTLICSGFRPFVNATGV